ncbi:hypothetical protein GH741_15820 [Aquibacillus halophilus]|uniref:Uncharacterized protein n=1 Tax=Aquibacillus halophilus TaxID=930132 RepID=A0A6A8DK21_9BACI|nr:hypothetical protein [Aquibacillus halophilus]MRH44109.1 hypothetical protein [Aquibacillus halophilus]
MSACPLCNGVKTLEQACSSCGSTMDNQGRLVDYMGDYIAYLDYEGTNLIDGLQDSNDKHICVHLFQCSSCDEQIHVPIREIPNL